METYSDYIEAYFTGALSTEERQEFEKRIEMNKDFAAEVAFYLSAKQVLKEEVIREKKEWFRQLAAENAALSDARKPGQVRKMWVYRVAAAAAVISVIFFSWYLFVQKPGSPTQLADKYIRDSFQTLGVKMSTTKDSLQIGVQLYNKGQFASAAEILESVAQRDSLNTKARTNAGIAYLRSGNYDKALANFLQLEKTPLYSNPGVFYQALTLLKRNQSGDKRRAWQLLQKVVDDGLDQKETAQQWLKKDW